MLMSWRKEFSIIFIDVALSVQMNNELEEKE